jgi:hypothetical protein
LADHPYHSRRIRHTRSAVRFVGISRFADADADADADAHAHAGPLPEPADCGKPASTVEVSRVLHLPDAFRAKAEWAEPVLDGAQVAPNPDPESRPPNQPLLSRR